MQVIFKDVDADVIVDVDVDFETDAKVAAANNDGDGDDDDDDDDVNEDVIKFFDDLFCTLDNWLWLKGTGNGRWIFLLWWCPGILCPWLPGPAGRNRGRPGPLRIDNEPRPVNVWFTATSDPSEFPLIISELSPSLFP